MVTFSCSLSLALSSRTITTATLLFLFFANVLSTLLEYDFNEDVFTIATTLGDDLTDDGSGLRPSFDARLYVGGNDVVFMLDEGLRVLNSTRLHRCEPGSNGSSNGTARHSCENKVIVLEVDRKLQRLLACGAGNADNGGGGGGVGDDDGAIQCWILGLEDLTNHGSFKSPFHYDGSRKRTSKPIFRQVNDADPKGESSGRSTWIVASPSSSPSSKSILSVIRITESRSSENKTTPSYELTEENSIAKCNESFKFDIVDGFCRGSKCFFLTLQQKNASSMALISRVASVCSDSLLPYVEISFNKATDFADSVIYNRAVTFVIGDIGFQMASEPVVVTLFRNASSVTGDVETRKGFGVSLSKLTEFENSRNSTIKAITSDKVPTPDWNVWPDCASVPRSNPQTCQNSSKPVIQSNKGDPAELLSSVGSHDKDIGHVTALFTHTQKEKGRNKLHNKMTIYVIMSTGTIHRFSVKLSSSTGVFDMKKVTDVGDTVQKTHQRRGVAVTDQNFYLLSGSKVEGRPLDYCQSLDTCKQCKEAGGCAWCSSNATCLLAAKCPSEDGEDCPPSIEKFEPASGPVTGGTILSIIGTNLQTHAATAIICGRKCQTTEFKQGYMVCRVPAYVKKAKGGCPVVVKIPPDPSNSFTASNVTAAESFQYTIPAVHKFSPLKLLQSQGGNVEFRGRNLDTGSNATVRVTSENHTVRCQVTERKREVLRCHLANVTSPQRETGDEGVTSPDNATGTEVLQADCYNATVTIDDYDLPTDVKRLLCLRPNPSVSSMDHNITFVGGSVGLTVRGNDLDLAVVRLIFNGTESDKTPCKPCQKRETDGKCLVCCTPDVTNLITSPIRDGLSTDVRFTMTSSQTGDELQPNAESPERFTVTVRRDPEFRFVDLAENASCSVPGSDSILKIKASFLPPLAPYSVTVGRRMIPSCISHAGITPLSPTINCNLAVLRDQQFHGSNNDDAVSPCGSGGGADGDREEYKHKLGTHDEVVRVLVYGRSFTVGCLNLLTLFSETKEPPPWNLIAGGAGGFLLLLVLVVGICCYVRYRKRQFQERRHYHAQHSSASAGMLLRSDSGGSGNHEFISVERVLNPTGDREKQKKIQDSGLIIQRKNLNMGNVIGQGNFGCVFEGQYQTRDGDALSWKMVAIKTLLDPATHAIDIKSFIDEAMLMKDFNHVHVMSLLGLSDGDRGPLVVLPYMDRGDLLAYVKNESTVLSIGDVLKFAKDIASGMEYLASNKFVHRDLAARNCMLDDQLNVKVADFGLCRDVYEKGYYRSDNKKKLPIRWMAVESIESGTYTPKSDVWSLGIVFWEMTTRGTTPYPGVEGWDILRYLVAGRRLDQPYFCPDALFALMERCWKAKPKERPPFRDIELDLVNLTDSFQEPAAANAVCVDTLITLPDCHRFKDDESVVQKVKEAMRNMSQGKDYSLAASITTSNTNSPQLSPTTILDTSTASSSVFEASNNNTPTTTSTNKNNNHKTVPLPDAGVGAFPFPSSSRTATASSPGVGLSQAHVGRREDPREGRHPREGEEHIPMRRMPVATSAATPAAVVRTVGGNDDPGQRRPPVVGLDDGYFLLERQEVESGDFTHSASSNSLVSAGGSKTDFAAAKGTTVTTADIHTPQSRSSPSTSRQQQQHQPDMAAEGEQAEQKVWNRPAVSFYNRRKLRDTAGKDDGYQYFELEREAECSKL